MEEKQARKLDQRRVEKKGSKEENQMEKTSVEGLLGDN